MTDTLQAAARASVLADIMGPMEVAEYLGVKVPTVWQWQKRGRLPFAERTISGVPLWTSATIDRWARDTGRL